ncbi:aldehyde dehydrogenase family protein [Paraburkholderia sp. FT54]|uniref:aldehyde dehydrogenase family protein n=1 Tax=Paraburkholderia sp. FT54 TaxID=3074437 RepID=UPI0038F6A841
MFHNQGQACIAGSRLFLHESIADEFIERFLKVAKRIRIGDPLDMAVQMGPLTSKEHQERVLAFCETARKEGDEILYGGRSPDAPLWRRATTSCRRSCGQRRRIRSARKRNLGPLSL